MTSPLQTMTLEDLRAQLVIAKDILNMLNTGSTNAQIAAKYGYYPASHDEAVRSLFSIEAEIKKKDGTRVSTFPASYQPLGCGVVGCWGKDDLGRTTLNGQLFPAQRGTHPNERATAHIPGKGPDSPTEMSMTAKVLIAAAVILVAFFFLPEN